MRFLLIYNPVSGGGRHQGVLEKALRYFRKKGDEVTVHQTSSPGEAETVARERGGGFDAVIGAGGDGTIHEVIGGLADTDIPLGILPWGTGNVFAREMRLPQRVKALCKIIRKGRVLSVDLGLADGRPFLLMASLGFDAYTLGRMAGFRSKRVLGMGAYALAAFDALVRYKHPVIEVSFEGGSDRGSFVLISNTRLYGAFFVFHPSAHPADGWLDVLVFRDAGRWKMLGMLVQLFWSNFRRPYQPPSFLARHGVYRVRSLKIAGHGLPAQVDGEYLPGGVVNIAVSPSALRVLLPKKVVAFYTSGHR